MIAKINKHCSRVFTPAKSVLKAVHAVSLIAVMTLATFAGEGEDDALICDHLPQKTGGEILDNIESRPYEGIVLCNYNQTISPEKVQIVVNFGPYASPEAAALSEDKVNWLDADTGDDTVCSECFAAVELQSYLRKLTGRTTDFEIVDDDATTQGELILVGGPASNALARKLSPALGADATSLAALGPEDYRLKTGDADGRRITLIAGGSRVGTLYGVYDLLHRLGCRWFGPDGFQEEIPQTQWEPDFDATEKPAFAIRGFHIYEKRGGPEFWLWMARNRLNYWCIQAGDVPLLRKLGIRLACGVHDAEWLFLSPESPYPYDHAQFPGDEDRPKDPYAPSDRYRGDDNKDGKLSYFEAHPEWYPLVDGKRIPGVEKWGGTNFCTSNADATEEFTKNYVDALVDGIYRGADAVNFWVLDGGKWCQCPACQAQGTATDRYLRLVYNFDRQVKKAQREKRLHRPVEVRFLAYADVVEPPTRPLPDDFDYHACAATFYPISRCYVHNIDDPKCPRNEKYQKLLDGWLLNPDRHYRGQVEIGEYYNVSRYKSLPLCLMHAMAHDIPYYYKTGARYFQYMHVTTGRWGSKSLTNYQMARQIWDVNTDCQALWSDYFSRRYGPAAGVMRQFYESLEKMLDNVEPLKGWSSNLASRLQAGEEQLFVEPHLQYRREPAVEADAPTLVEMVEHGRNCRTLINRAAAMELPDRIKARVAEDERTFTYAERTLAYYDACVQAFMLGRSGQREQGRRHFDEAKRLADLLRQDTWSVDLSFIHDEPFPLDAFHSTYAAGALQHLQNLYNSTESEKE